MVKANVSSVMSLARKKNNRSSGRYLVLTKRTDHRCQLKKKSMIFEINYLAVHSLHTYNNIFGFLLLKVQPYVDKGI